MNKLRFNPVNKLIKKLKSIEADPAKIAYGYAFGTFLSTTPLIGIKWIVALPILWMTKWNKLSCMVGIFQVNYFTGPLFYGLAYFIGKSVCGFDNSFELPDPLTFSAMKDIILSNADVFISILTGGMILSIPMTLGAFFFVKSILPRKVNPRLT
jgi:uncharacterized protein